MKEVYYVKDTLSNILEGPYKSFYLNGEPESRGQFQDNEASGVWEFFYETGTLKTRAQVKAGDGNDGYYEYFYESGEKSMEGFVNSQRQVGFWKFYYENGTLKEAGNFTEGLRDGEWKGYFEDGQLSSKTAYSAGSGERREYYSSGELHARGPVKGNLRTGYWQYFSKAGKKEAEGSFSRDKRNGEWVFYHDSGVVASRGAYDDNVAVGVWDYYDQQGDISSRGAFRQGAKQGNWEIFYPGGTIKGSANFDNGSGPYREFYKSGELRAEGQIKDGLSEGEWVYYFEDGAVEGKCTFEKGRGTYVGFYPDGGLQTRGTIENGKRVGRWELFDEEGTLTGYYMPIYQGEELINLPDPRPTRDPRNYGVADYKFKGSKTGYFDRRLNEYNGLILESNPLMTLIGRFPISLEMYMEDRLGYQLSITGIRDPFFKNDSDIALNETFKRGYQVAFQQRFYNPSQFGLWYFGYELRFNSLQHYARIELNPGEIDKISSSENRVDGSVLLGYRIMRSTSEQGFTIDSYITLGGSYRSFKEPPYYTEVFSDLDQDKFSFRFGFGLMVGYVFPFSNNRRR
ncbi:toxin-antitoxin system YwqK family antitoxin [Fulvivirga sedimenti]|uniref:Membrane-binding protein n=1 Tax=Fulvivirga sedimenti TaxID=2879465 RepID=A0A9X1HJM8_9BACT|nr:toxin-antitoxin system YwqK family antitoxin [Fulvivirga sedimenti]MCA6073389.1 hypothetical protein [Fulvivirga sedimenti]